MISTVIYEGDLRTVATHLHSGSKIETDAPLDNQGRAERFSPTDLVATALASCMMTIMGIKARDMAIDLKGLQMEVEKIMTSNPRRIAGIHVKVTGPNGLVLEEKDQLILERAARTCPVRHSVHPDIDVQMDFTWG